MARMTQDDIRREYRKLRHAYAQRKYYYKKKGIELPDLEAPVKKPKKADITKLKSEVKRKAKKGISAAPSPIVVPTPYVSIKEAIEYDRLIDMLEGVPELMSSDQAFYRAGARHSARARALAEGNAHDLIKMLEDAKKKHGPVRVIKSLKKKFGEDFSRVMHEIERISYAMYDKEYAAWGGQGFRRIMIEFESALEDIED